MHARKKIDSTLEETWERLMSPAGLAAEGTIEGLAPGDRLAVRTATGDRLEGSIEIIKPPKDLAAFIDNLNDAYLRVRIDRACNTVANQEVNLWLSTYDLEQAEVETLQEHFDTLLAKLFEKVDSAS